eukprot:GHVU01123909.1.p1 GENE.GHVU01123909.1~~GHVU01123909.1.p1  ORF type:complete len:173 (-),score=16.15 GHVU01123909.1:1174-1692(-)
MPRRHQNSLISSLVELQLWDRPAELFPETFRGDFTKLEKLFFSGVGSTRCFVSMSVSCSHSLLELELNDFSDPGDAEYVDGFPEGLGGNLKKLEKLSLDGNGASQRFASVSESLAASLVEVRIWQPIGSKFVDAIPGEFVKLKFLTLNGVTNAKEIFKHMKVDHDSVKFYCS